jgi:hypothetical protein
LDFSGRELVRNKGRGTEFSSSVIPVGDNPSWLISPL